GNIVKIFHDPSDRVGYWEGRITPMAGATLLATCWAHGWSSDRDLPNHYSLSHDGGMSWGAPLASPVMGQTGWPLWLGDAQIAFVYNRRQDPVGVRAQIAKISAERWDTVFDAEVWTPENRAASSISKNDYAVTGFQFGAPSAIRLDEGHVMVVYWCVENARAGINWSMMALRW
ncbi:MAG: hypothetical protein KKD33_09615, partial [Verrucomicrobia bacterium]|nr:hypothetical protein [Verrucomicrobiota bacterium]